MSFKPGVKIWMNGSFVPWDEARVHVLSHVIHYGSSVFEGIRCYDTPSGPCAFRLDEHLRRLFDSAKVYRIEIPFTLEELRRASLDTVIANGLDACYIRPVVYRGYGSIGVNPQPSPVEVAVAAWEWGAYLGEEALREGVDVQISTWFRMAPNTLPAMAKAGANYANSQLVKMEAILNGFVEGIVLDVDGYLSEGSGENLFLVRGGKLYTPPLGASILAGITRASVIRLAREAGIEVEQTRIPREAVYMADEVFLTGTAAEVTPIRSVDRIPIGSGRPGPVTLRLQSALLDILTGKTEDLHGWLSPVTPVPTDG